jgi:hypothetical protein
VPPIREVRRVLWQNVSMPGRPKRGHRYQRPRRTRFRENFGRFHCLLHTQRFKPPPFPGYISRTRTRTFEKICQRRKRLIERVFLAIVPSGSPVDRAPTDGKRANRQDLPDDAIGYDRTRAIRRAPSLSADRLRQDPRLQAPRKETSSMHRRVEDGENSSPFATSHGPNGSPTHALPGCPFEFRPMVYGSAQRMDYSRRSSGCSC